MHLTARSIACFSILVSALAEAAEDDFTQYVNVFQGVDNGGNRFPGVVAAPFAMVKLGPDVQDGETDAYSGYLSKGKIWGFSMMHESGTGGAPKYGVVSQMPVLGNASNPLGDLSQERAAPDEGRVGYYKSSLANGITVELTASEHAGLYRYTSPGTFSIVVDVSHVLPSFRGRGWEQHYSGGDFSVRDDGYYEGYGTYNNGWNLSPDWNIYFCGRFSEKPVRSRTFKGNDDKFTTYENATRVSGEERVGGAFTFDSTSVSSRVGISFMSTKRACENLDKRLDGNRSFEYLVKKAEERWNSVLSRIQIEPEKDDDKKLLYSSMYGMFLIPSNRTGENPHWKSDEPYYDDVFTLWDTHRSHTALFHILQPVAYEEFIRSLIDIWRHDGWMPDARSSNFNGRVQGGSNADNVLADAFVKGVRGGINWEDAYRAMKTNAEVVPANNNDPSAPDSSTKEGRGALADWKKYGYITPDYSRSVSRAVEYSANDFALYQVAKGLGKQEDADKYLNRSRNWRNHWNKNATSNGHSGFLVPRYANGSFAEQDPTDCGGCYWKDAYFQDNPWLYSLNALHDVWHLKDLIGGEDKFIDRLDKLFDLDLFNAGNEPGFVAPYLYNFARLPRQHLSAKRSRQISSLYGSGNDGLPGNSDAGAMEANLLWQMIGLYPITGQTTFLILSPWFPHMTIQLGNGKTLNITVKRTGGDRDKAYHVQWLKLNGKTWDKAWLTWEDISEGATLEFVQGTSEDVWPLPSGPPPPSPASVHFQKP